VKGISIMGNKKDLNKKTADKITKEEEENIYGDVAGPFRPGQIVEVEDIRTFPFPVKEEWISILKTQVEDSKGEHYLVELQQNTQTKDLRTVKV
jgi:hypothetical protein